ncbi:Fe-S cluster assembly protein HesB [Cohnella xylanilytica]|uniref:Fe-S cluster assembly protein HesB n=1 Tax=Cohnella xylanilytica TaxID=557555 RepID=A0A841U173_9BACL|nr:Fe-S cluster assembly protein HesB [Cohnella xylanilytica]MBB6691861.1 Fe-S cluster assembly protein HesB [Cohnella xylanilytica]
MELVISPAALSCFRHDWGFKGGDSVRIFVRYVSGGSEPYGFGIMKDEPMDPAAVVENDKLTFYMESKDVWFLERKKLTVDCLRGDIVFLVG